MNGDHAAAAAHHQKAVAFDESTMREKTRGSDRMRRNRSLSDDALQTTARRRKSKPRTSAFNQQRLPAFQPVLTPQNTMPVLLLLGLLFVPLGIVFLAVSSGVEEYVMDYTDCLRSANSTNHVFTSHDWFEWSTDGLEKCYVQFRTQRRMRTPVFLYYQLSNFYQNNRLYAKSYSAGQLQGKALKYGDLQDCTPLIGPNEQSVYYPCGMIANSYFSDRISVKGLDFTASGTAYSFDRQKRLYGQSSYDVERDKVYPPISWDAAALSLDLNSDGTYRTLPRLDQDERFMNWMRLSGLATFRKLYGRHEGSIAKNTKITIEIASRYNVTAYGGRKAVVLSTSSWMGGKNVFLGVAYISFGSFLILTAALCLAKHLLVPRPLGDTRFLSWTSD